MQAGFISVMGFWVGGYGGFEAAATYTEVVTISRLSLAKDIIIAGLKMDKDVIIANLET
jgi:hypothetical protein